MLQCLIVAVRPLRVEELAELLAFEFGIARGAVPKYRTDWRPSDQVDAVLSTCSSLITIVDDHGSQVVQFSHFSVKEFLTSDRLSSSLGDFSHYRILPEPAHTILAQACLGFLLHSDGHADEDIGNDFPLAEYAARHWVTHAQFEDVASHVKSGMMSLFDCDKPHFAAWVGIYDMDEESSPESPSKIAFPLYYSSLCGFSDLVEHLSTKHPGHVNAIGGKHNFPLLAALVGKHIRAAETLLEHGADVEIRGMRERTPLHEAIDNVGMMQSLLSKGANVNCQQDDQRTPLHLAAYHRELKVARVLVERNADVNSRDKEGKTPLFLLLEDSSLNEDSDNILELARLLLEHGTDTNIRTTKEWTMLHAAAFWGRLEIAKLLLEHGANPNVENDEGSTPLHQVPAGIYDSRGRGVDIARLLLEHGADVDARKKNGRTPLHSAAFRGRLDIVQILLGHSANPNMENNQGSTPLHQVSQSKYSSQEHSVSIARLLLEHDVDVNARKKNGFTPLHSAALNGRLEIAQVLLDHGANSNAVDEIRETALHLVSRGEYNSQDLGVRISRLLLKHGADVHAKNKYHHTALSLAAFNGRLEITRLLLDNGANPNVENDQGSTPLHLLSQGQYDSPEHGVGIVRLLLERGIDVNVSDRHQKTPLHSAASEGRLEIAQLRLDSGANANAENEERETELHLVSRGEYDSQEFGVGISRMLLKHGVDVHSVDKYHSTALSLASFNWSVENTQPFLDSGANSNVESDQGSTPLHRVSTEHGASIARLLLERGVDVNARNKTKLTALHLTAFYGRLEIAQVHLTFFVKNFICIQGDYRYFLTMARTQTR